MNNLCLVEPPFGQAAGEQLKSYPELWGAGFLLLLLLICQSTNQTLLKESEYFHTTSKKCTFLSKIIAFTEKRNYSYSSCFTSQGNPKHPKTDIVHDTKNMKVLIFVQQTIFVIRKMKAPWSRTGKYKSQRAFQLHPP